MALSSYCTPPQALLGGGHQMDLTKFQHTLWDILIKGDSVKVSSAALHFQHPLLFVFFLSISSGYLHSSFTPSFLYYLD